MSGSKADLLVLMRADRVVQNRRKAEHAAVDVEATKERVPTARRAGRSRQTTRSTKRLNRGAAGAVRNLYANFLTSE
jgi:hypothetical protein